MPEIAWIPPGTDRLPPGSDLIPTPGGYVPGKGSGNTPSYDGPTPEFPPDDEPRPLPKPVADMNPLEILLETLSRVPRELGNELRQQFKDLLANKEIVGVMAILMIALSMIAGPLVSGGIFLAGILGAGQDIKTLAEAFLDMLKAKETNDESKLDSAAKKLALVLASYGAGKLDKLADALKAFKALASKAIQGSGISGSIKLTEILGWEKAMARLPQMGQVANGLEQAVKNLELNPQFLDALGAVERSDPGSAAKALDSILEYGPDAVEILARRGRPKTLSDGTLLTSNQGIGDNLEAWAKRLSEVSPEEGAEILDKLKYANEVRDTVRKATSGRGKIPNRRNVGFTDDFIITIPNHEPVTGNRGTHIGISGTEEFEGALPIPQNPTFPFRETETRTGTRTNETDSEFRILNAIAKSIQERFGVNDVDQIPPEVRGNISGTVKIFTERKLCDACFNLIYLKQEDKSGWKDKFPGIDIQVIHGPSAKDIR